MKNKIDFIKEIRQLTANLTGFTPGLHECKALADHVWSLKQGAIEEEFIKATVRAFEAGVSYDFVSKNLNHIFGVDNLPKEF